MVDLVRAVVPTADGDRVVTIGRTRAEMVGLDVLEGEPTRTAAGNPVRESRPNGRPAKPKTSVAKKAAEKKAASTATTSSQPSEEN